MATAIVFLPPRRHRGVGTAARGRVPDGGAHLKVRGRVRGTARRHRHVVVAVVFLAAISARALPQYLTRPSHPWQTVQTAHFTFHFPSSMRDWAVDVAQRMESVASTVNAAVGNVPGTRVTVLVEDPSSVSNGFALPFLEGPLIFLWPTPPAPSPAFGAYREWGETLAVHEYAHIAHLTFPSRNPTERLLWRFLPEQIGPVARKAPEWVIEGYATLIEGDLTGDGRPNSVGRAAVLRQWALEGKLPIYSQLDLSSPFLGGSMRYLVGSAFLDWLRSAKGDSSLVYLWRRMSARQRRSFGSAFTGVFGAPPDDLYGRFFVEVIRKSLEIDRRLKEAGLVEGELVQRLYWATGEPAVSPDGTLMAVVLRSSTAPSRLVVWRTASENADSLAAARRTRLLRLDSLDVPATDSFPPPRREIATLLPFAGRSHDLPRWLPDNVHLLVNRDEPIGDGASRPDLFLWNYRTGALRRVTYGASIHHADPSPDGKMAAGVRCADGRCGLVIVDLATGAWHTLVAAHVNDAWYRPRWSSDGRRIAASHHVNGRWVIAIVDAVTGDVHVVDPGDGASRYAPSWTANGDAVVEVSERGGIANLERLQIDDARATTLTRVTGAALAPDVSRTDNQVYFLSLHAKGYDLRRLPLDSATGARNVVALDPELSPAAPPRPDTAGPAFAAAPISPPRAYGLGPRRWRILPGEQLTTDGALATLMIANIDPIARLSVVAQGGYGEAGTWRGASLSAAVHRLPVDFEGSVWYTNRRGPANEDATPLPFDGEYAGSGVVARFDRDYSAISYTLRAGGSIGEVGSLPGTGNRRAFGFGEARAQANLSVGARVLSVGVSLHGSGGTTGAERWNRTIMAVGAVVGTRALALRAEASVGAVDAADVGDARGGRAFEQFVVGGADVPYFDRAFVSQQLPLPGVPIGFLGGKRVGLYRLSVPGAWSFEPFATWVAAGDALERWKRVFGLQRSFASEALGFARLPQVRASAGASYSLDAPYRHKARLWVTAAYRP
jgi:hypothetical protein